MHFYYSWDSESRAVYTDHGVFDGRQLNWKNGVTRSYSLGIGWTRYLLKNLAATGGLEFSVKNVTTDTLYFTNSLDKSAIYNNEVSYLNFPLGVRYAIGNKIKLGAFAGAAFKFKLEEGGSFYKRYADGSAGNMGPYGGVPTFPRRETDRYNMDGRFSLFAEYEGKHIKWRLMPVYRIDLRDTYKWMSWKNAVSKGIVLEVNF